MDAAWWIGCALVWSLTFAWSFGIRLSNGWDVHLVGFYRFSLLG